MWICWGTWRFPARAAWCSTSCRTYAIAWNSWWQLYGSYSASCRSWPSVLYTDRPNIYNTGIDRNPLPRSRPRAGSPGRESGRRS